MSKFYWIKIYGERCVENKKGKVWIRKSVKAKTNIEAMRRMYNSLKHQGYGIIKIF
jgi:hypothetical protein